MQNIEEIKNPKFSASDNSRIDVVIVWANGEEHPFTAAAEDVEPLGREIYSNCLVGEHGPIEPCEER